MKDIEIREQLERILKSERFSRSTVSVNLLKYLTEASIKGEKPKQYTISVDVFNHTADDPSTSNIRVHILKLRKKLTDYYNNEGKNDAIYFTIPKGGYSIKFKSKSNFSIKKPNKDFWYTAIIIALVVVLVSVYFVLQQTGYDKLGKTAFWKELATNNKEMIVVAGDFYMFSDYLENCHRDWFIRDPHVNSEKQLLEFMSTVDSLNPKDFNTKLGVSYLTRDALFTMPYLIPFFYENKIDYRIILSSNFNWEVYHNHNIIYIGSFKSTDALSILLEKLHINYDHIINSALVTSKEGKVKRYESSIDEQTNTNIDYTLVAKVPGPNNNVVYLFVSDNDIGCIESVKQFTNREKLKEFKKEFLKKDNYFRAIYKAEGIIRTGITFSLVDYQPINDSSLSSFWHFKTP